MILVVAVLAGLLAGLCRAWIGKRKYRAYELKMPILVLLAFIPQYFIFFAPKTRVLIPDTIVRVLFVLSLLLLLAFSIFNIRKTGFWLIGFGFLCNFVVILLNGGFMPISFETASKISAQSGATLVIGQRFGYTKDLILAPETIKLAFLSDRFVINNLLGSNIAFSLGDLLISAGVLWLLWTLGGNPNSPVKEHVNE